MAVVASDGSLVSTQRTTLVPNIARGIELYSGFSASYATLYRLQPNLRLVIRFLSRNIGSLGLKAYRRTSATDRVELESEHELSQFLKSPTPSLRVPTSRHAWIRGLVEDLALYDAVFVSKIRNAETGKLNGIRIPPTMATPIGENFFDPDAIRVTGNQGYVDYPPEAILYVHGHNPEDPRLGLSSVESLRRILAEEAAAGQWREQYWRGAARIAGVIERPIEAPKWGDTARKRFTDGWRSSYTNQGGDAGSTPVLEEGMSFKETSFSSKESEYLGARRLSREETAAAYFIPPVFVGILENANFANIKEQHVSLYADTLGPWLDDLEGALELQLLPEFDDVDDVYLEFNIAAKLAGSFEEQAAAMQTATGAPWLLRSEARAMRNLPFVPGSEELVVPLNVLVGGQASPTDSAPLDPGFASSSSSSTKALPRGTKAALPRNLQGWEAKHVEVLRGFFDRQSSSVLSKLGAGQDLPEAFDRARWDAELGTDLLALNLGMSEDLGGDVASTFGTDFDVDRTTAYLAENARIAAESINGATFDALSTVWSGVPARGQASRKALAADLAELGLDLAEDDLEDPLSGDAFLTPARDVFETASSSRALQIATTRATSIGQWSRREGASQAGVRSKVWRSSGTDTSRHEDLDGETVALGEAFSNGGQYPGDPELGVDETAGCLCSLDFSN